MGNMHLIVGLGNPGNTYANTWHNAGFLALDNVCKNLNLSGWQNWRNRTDFIQTEISGKKVFLLKPMEFMNNSGKVLSSFMHFYKITPKQILVCYDDVSLDLGTLRIRRQGSSGGHRGMEDIITHLGSSDFARLRIGVGPVMAGQECKKYVLARIPKAKQKSFNEVLAKCADAIETIIKDDISKAMNTFN